MANTGIIILAAGSSSRLGKPKQLLKIEGKTLLQKTIDAALSAQLKPIVVVLGSNADEIRKQHAHNPVNFVVNAHWENGMSAIIVRGLEVFRKDDEQQSNVIISVCDQPFIHAQLFKALITKQLETSKGIIASKYGDAVGTPVLFSAKYDQDLMLLKGNKGAKKLIQTHATDLETIDFEKGMIDIDTEKDYQNLLKK